MKKTILTIDDNESVTETIKYDLMTLNPDWEVISARSGKEGIKFLETKAVDVILLDIMMPEMDGWGVTTLLKENKKTNKIPIIFLTAKTDDLSKGMGGLASDDYIEKPFDMFDLNKRIKKILKTK
ncbi:MAG: two-component system response regulator [Candidatus Woesearchaeota archaeon]